jgi:hypothetical protein
VCLAVIRTTVVALIAFAIVLPPASGYAIPLPLLSPSPAEVTMADHADMPCCPSCDTQACDTHGNFKATACALKCAALAGTVLPASTVALLYITEASLSALAENALHTHVITPTHPPPI